MLEYLRKVKVGSQLRNRGQQVLTIWMLKVGLGLVHMVRSITILGWSQQLIAAQVTFPFGTLKKGLTQSKASMSYPLDGMRRSGSVTTKASSNSTRPSKSVCPIPPKCKSPGFGVWLSALYRTRESEMLSVQRQFKASVDSLEWCALTVQRPGKDLT